MCGVYINTRLAKAWTATDRLSVIWKSDLTDKMKRSFVQAAVVSILLYGRTTWTLTKRMEKKLDGNYKKMLWTILNKFWRQHPTKQQLYGHLPPIMKTIKVRRTRYAGHWLRSRDELISDVLLWTPWHGRAKAGSTSLNLHTVALWGTGSSPEDLPEAMNDKEEWREKQRRAHVMFSYGPPLMAEQKHSDKLEPTYRSTGISVLVAWQDDDDMYVYMKTCANANWNVSIENVMVNKTLFTLSCVK